MLFFSLRSSRFRRSACCEEGTLLDSFSYHLETFDGPLDLLLQMLSKNKLDICEVSILSIVDQYVEQVHAMQAASMDVAS